MNRIISFLLICFAGSLIFFSCKTTRSTLKKPIKEYGFEYLYEKMLENQADFDYLKVKFNVVFYQDKKKTDLKGQLRIKKDSLTWISLSPAS